MLALPSVLFCIFSPSVWQQKAPAERSTGAFQNVYLSSFRTWELFHQHFLAVDDVETLLEVLDRGAYEATLDVVNLN